MKIFSKAVLHNKILPSFLHIIKNKLSYQEEIYLLKINKEHLLVYWERQWKNGWEFPALTMQPLPQCSSQQKNLSAERQTH